MNTLKMTGQKTTVSEIQWLLALSLEKRLRPSESRQELLLGTINMNQDYLITRIVDSLEASAEELAMDMLAELSPAQ